MSSRKEKRAVKKKKDSPVYVVRLEEITKLYELRFLFRQKNMHQKVLQLATQLIRRPPFFETNYLGSSNNNVVPLRSPSLRLSRNVAWPQTRKRTQLKIWNDLPAFQKFVQLWKSWILAQTNWLDMSCVRWSSIDKFPFSTSRLSMTAMPKYSALCKKKNKTWRRRNRRRRNSVLVRFIIKSLPYRTVLLTRNGINIQLPSSTKKEIRIRPVHTPECSLNT